MSDPSSVNKVNKLKKFVGRFIYSDVAKTLSAIPPISWLIRKIAYNLAKSKVGQNTFAGQRNPGGNLEGALKGVVKDVVDLFGYSGAMIATYDAGDVLPVKAIYVDPNLATIEKIHEWEKLISDFSPTPVSITDEKIARVYIHRKEYKDNLSVIAAQEESHVIRDNLYDLFTPIAPPASKHFVKGIQDALDIQQVIAVPFFIQNIYNVQLEKEYVGKLFAV